MIRTAQVIALIVVASAAAGCARTQARTMPEMPALLVPAPPPRLVEPITDLASNDAEPVPEEIPKAAAPPAAPAPRPAAPIADASRAAAPPVETPPPVAPAPPPVLQTIPAVRESEVQRAIQADLDEAKAHLRSVTYASLAMNARANFDQAQRFISQAELALREKNFVFAETVANKAAILAKQLVGR